MNNIERYVKARDKMLLKCSVDELRKFVDKHKEYFNPVFVERMSCATDKVLEITLHKMIVNCTNLPLDFRLKSNKWLMDRGFSLEIGVTNET